MMGALMRETYVPEQNPYMSVTTMRDAVELAKGHAYVKIPANSVKGIMIFKWPDRAL